jgi:hypothetical protein
LPLLLVRQNLPVGVKSARSGSGAMVLVVVVVVVVVVGMLVVVDVVVSVMVTVPGPAGGVELQLSASAVRRTPIIRSGVRIRQVFAVTVRLKADTTYGL